MSQTDISKNNIDYSNNIIYPSLFNYNYPNDSSNNHFFLEAMNISDIQLWKNSFNYDLSHNIIINYKYLSKLLLDLKKCITNNLHFAGNSFSNKQLVLGNIYLYYIQFVSNVIFNVPTAFQPFLLNKKLKKSIMKFVDTLIDSFYDKPNLDTFIKNQFDIDSSNNIIFNIACIQFSIEIPSNIIKLGDKKITIPRSLWSINIIIGNSNQF